MVFSYLDSRQLFHQGAQANCQEFALAATLSEDF